MTTNIPDNVVETLWRDLCEKPDRTSPPEYPDMALITLDELRAAGRVFVEWERERLLGEVRHLEEDGLNGGWRRRTAKEIEAAMEKLKK
jgi:hypothetical protein